MIYIVDKHNVVHKCLHFEESESSRFHNLYGKKDFTCKHCGLKIPDEIVFSFSTMGSVSKLEIWLGAKAIALGALPKDSYKLDITE